MALLQETVINGKEYGVYYFTGKVVSEKKWSEPEVSGSGGGGGGYSHQGTGYSSTSPVNITSTTTRFDQFILQGRDEKEKSFNFQNMNIACRDGNILSVLWGIKKGKDEGPYWFVYNHNSEEIFTTDDYKSVFEPPFWMKASAFLTGIFIPYLFGMPWFMYLILPFAAVYIHRKYFYVVQENITLSQFKESETIDKIHLQLEAERNKFTDKMALESP